METHHRVIFPVGHGGFAFESIGDTNVIFDCGSDTAPARVKMYIDLLKAHGVTHIDYLFISHFDKDHVNALAYLKNHLTIKNVFVPMIPKNYRILYNASTQGAYNAIMNIFQENREIELIEISEQARRFDRTQPTKPLWEWDITNMLSITDLANLATEMTNEGIDVDSLDDVDYVSDCRGDINKAVISTFGPMGPNSKGLIVLSQKTQNAQVISNHLEQGPCCVLTVLNVANNDATDCLYVGDANLSRSKNIKDVQKFFVKYNAITPLLLMQVPHHGSQNNILNTFDTDFPAEYYFVHDISDARIQKKVTVYNALHSKNQLLMVRDVCHDLILGRIEVQ